MDPACTRWAVALITLLIGPTSRLLPTALADQPAIATHDVDFEDDVIPLLREYCFACHGPDEQTKGIGLHQYAAAQDLLDNRGVSEKVLQAIKFGRMPPVDSEAGPMSLDELALIRWWIDVGAPLPAAEGGGEEAAAESPAAPSPWERGRSWVGRLHPMVAHFPIALLLVAVLALALGARSSARFCVHVGAASAVAAAALGWINALDVRASWMLTTHRWLGVATALLALALAWLLERGLRSGAARPDGLTRAVLCVCALAVAATGFFGGSLIHGLDHLLP